MSDKVLPADAIRLLNDLWVENPSKFERLIAALTVNRPSFGSVTITFQDAKIIQVEALARFR